MDHHNYDASDDNSHTKIVVAPKQIFDVANIVGKISSPVLFKGVG